MSNYIDNDEAARRWPRLARVLAVLAIATHNEVASFLSEARNCGTAERCGPEAFTHSGRPASDWLRQAFLWRRLSHSTKNHHA